MSFKFYLAPYCTASITEAVVNELEAAAGKKLAERINVTLREGTKKPEYLAINPNGLVPAIVHNDVPLWESTAITMYLGEVFGVETKLYPADMTLRGQAMKWIVWTNVNLSINTRLIGLVMHGCSDEDDAMKALRKSDGDKAKVDLEKQLAILNDGLKGKQYLLGDEYSLADTHVWSFMTYVKMLGASFDGLDNLNAWLEKISARPALKGLE